MTHRTPPAVLLDTIATIEAARAVSLYRKA